MKSIIGKSILYSVVFSLLSFLSPACQSELLSDADDCVDNVLESSGEAIDSLNITFFVTDDDIQSYIHFKSLILKNEVSVLNIIPIKDRNDITLLYIINYDDGWDLLAADKRVTIPLGSCSVGHLDISNNDNPLHCWIACMAEDVLKVRKTDDLKSREPELVEFCVNLWKAITADQSLFFSIIQQIIPEEQTRDHIFPIGHYVLDDVYDIVIPYDSIPHMTQTWWRQSGEVCNYYIPFKSDYSSRAPAGCTNIAGAQMLYYLHNTIGVPTQAPSTAYCNGNVNNWEMGQGDFSSSVWSQMTSDGDYNVAKLIASVAQNTPTHFANSGSTAYINNLASNTLPIYNIAATHSSYNDSIVRNSLLNGMPVIVTAYPALLDPIGHTFIIDGYYRTRHEFTFVYNWVWEDDDPYASHPKIPSYTEVSYTSPEIIAYEMNWGWGQEFYDTKYHFAPSGPWIPLPETGNYTHYRTMLYNFTSTL